MQAEHFVLAPVDPEHRCYGWMANGGKLWTARLSGCPGSVITVLMLSPSKVQYCDN